MMRGNAKVSKHLSEAQEPRERGDGRLIWGRRAWGVDVRTQGVGSVDVRTQGVGSRTWGHRVGGVDVGTQGVGDMDVGTQGVEGMDIGNLGSYAERGRAGILTVKMCLVDLVRKRN